MTLHEMLHPVRRGRIISNITVVDLPDLVWTNRSVADLTGTRIAVHRQGDGTTTACRRSLSLFGLDATVDIRARDAGWCRGCWPGRRCEACGAPSGQAEMCVACNQVDLDADVRIGGAES